MWNLPADDVTMVSEPAFAEVRKVEETPLPDWTSPSVKRSADGTLFIEFHGSEPKFGPAEDGTPVFERPRSPAQPSSVAPPSSHSQFERTRDDRLALLARRYVAGGLSPEDDARLRIATERIRRLLPYVTPADIEVVETMVGEVEALDARLEAIRARFGIAPKPDR